MTPVLSAIELRKLRIGNPFEPWQHSPHIIHSKCCRAASSTARGILENIYSDQEPLDLQPEWLQHHISFLFSELLEFCEFLAFNKSLVIAQANRQQTRFVLKLNYKKINKTQWLLIGP